MKLRSAKQMTTQELKARVELLTHEFSLNLPAMRMTLEIDQRMLAEAQLELALRGVSI